MIRMPDVAPGARSRLTQVLGIGMVAVAVGGCGAAAPPAPAAPSGVTAAPIATAAASGTPDPNAPEIVAAGDIPDNQVYVPYTAPGGGFTVAVPQGWARSSDGAATVFSDKFNTVRVEMLARPTAPDAASARATEVPALASARSFTLGDVTTVNRKAGSAVLITYTAASPVDPVTGKSVLTSVERYEFWRAGQEVVLTLSGAKGADNVDPWRTVSDSFRWRS
jgi:hypothetical protein